MRKKTGAARVKIVDTCPAGDVLRLVRWAVKVGAVGSGCSFGYAPVADIVVAYLGPQQTPQQLEELLLEA